MAGEASDAEIGAFLVGLRMLGETPAEIAAGARVLRAKLAPVEAPANAVDTAGTGGDGAGTLNISTAAAIIAAGAGAHVAKHGNKALSSKSGSAEVLAALGVNLDVPPGVISECIKEAGVGFMFAPAHHAAMRHVAQARRTLGLRTVFNLLGPLANPAGAKRQVLGVYVRDWVRPMAAVLRELGAEHAWVVHGEDGLDEITLTGATHIAEVRDGEVYEFDISPEDADLGLAPLAALKGGGPEENAEAMRRMLAGEAGAYRDIAALNAAAALIVAGHASDLREGADMALAALDDGRAQRALGTLVRLTNEDR